MAVDVAVNENLSVLHIFQLMHQSFGEKYFRVHFLTRHDPLAIQVDPGKR